MYGDKDYRKHELERETIKYDMLNTEFTRRCKEGLVNADNAGSYAEILIRSKNDKADAQRSYDQELAEKAKSASDEKTD